MLWKALASRVRALVSSSGLATCPQASHYSVFQFPYLQNEVKTAFSKTVVKTEKMNKVFIPVLDTRQDPAAELFGHSDLDFLMYIKLEQIQMYYEKLKVLYKTFLFSRFAMSTHLRKHELTFTDCFLYASNSQHFKYINLFNAYSNSLR